MIKSFACALEGIFRGFKGRNFKIHLGVATLVLVASVWLKISISEWIIVLILIGVVLAAELFNTSIEELANTVRDEDKLGHEATRSARDLAAGAVLVAAMAAAVTGLIIFLPKINIA